MTSSDTQASDNTEKKPFDIIVDIMGSHYAVAKKLNLTPSAIYKWDFAKPPRKHCEALANMSNGKVTKEQLRPDVKKWDNGHSVIIDLRNKLSIYESVNGYINTHLLDVEKSLRSTIEANDKKLADMPDSDDKVIQSDINQMLKDRLATVQAALEITEG